MRRRSTKWLLRRASPDECVDWNTQIANNPGGGSILQTTHFAHIKTRQGWQANYFIFETPDGPIATLALARKIFLLGDLWYFPKGPSLKATKDFDDALYAIRTFIKNNKLRVFLIKVEPELSMQQDTYNIMTRAGFVPAPFIQANESTIILAVHDNAEAQTSHLGRRARRYIRRAQRESVTVELMSPSPENFKKMYSFMQTAYGGRGIPGLRQYDYYENFWRTYICSGVGKLYFGFEDNKPTVGVFVVLIGKKAVYKDGGSATDRDAKGTAYYIHWYIMNELAKEGVTEYDLWGSPPSNQVDNPEHPLWGIGNFKTAFSKQIIDYIGVWDGVINTFKYAIWKIVLYKIIRLSYRLRDRSFW